jgi:dipeptide transport system ATP-binding protein
MTEPLVSARDLVQIYSLRRGPFRAPDLLTAVRGVSFDIASGQTLAVVGESGSGKSTLGRMVGLIERPAQGKLTLEGIDAVTPPAGTATKLRRLVQFVFQNPFGSLNPRKKVGAILEEPLAINTDLSREERRAKAMAMMTRVGLRPEHYARFPHMFSGGQRQRIAIARALMLQPKLVVADEPVSALDVSIQAQVLNLLADLQRDTQVAYLFISHDLGVVEHISDRVAVMYLGKVVELADRRDLFRKQEHPYTEALMSAIPVPNPELRRQRIILKGDVPSPLRPPSGCRFHPRCQLRASLGNPAICAAEEPPLADVATNHFCACHFRGPNAQPIP